MRVTSAYGRVWHRACVGCFRELCQLLCEDETGSGNTFLLRCGTTDAPPVGRRSVDTLNQCSYSARSGITFQGGCHCQSGLPMSRRLACGSHVAAAAVLTIRRRLQQLLRRSRGRCMGIARLPGLTIRDELVGCGQWCGLGRSRPVGLSASSCSRPWTVGIPSFGAR